MNNQKLRTVATFIQGRAIGVVQEPVFPGGVPKGRRGDLWLVKIGFIDGKGPASGPYPAQTFDGVVRELRASCAPRAWGETASQSAITQCPVWRQGDRDGRDVMEFTAGPFGRNLASGRPPPLGAIRTVLADQCLHRLA